MGISIEGFIRYPRVPTPRGEDAREDSRLSQFLPLWRSLVVQFTLNRGCFRAIERFAEKRPLYPEMLSGFQCGLDGRHE
jgi:hypothetical protein